jgi:hypothetical protein
MEVKSGDLVYPADQPFQAKNIVQTALGGG